jgi:hypothetical protein
MALHTGGFIKGLRLICPVPGQSDPDPNKERLDLTIQTNAYPTAMAALAAQDYFARHGATVRPGPPPEVRGAFLVAFTWET